MSHVKTEARKIINRLPENSTWEDIMYQFYVTEKIEKGLYQLETGKVYSHTEVKKKLLRA